MEHAARLSLEDCELDGVALVAGDTAKPFVRNCRLHGRLLVTCHCSAISQCVCCSSVHGVLAAGQSQIRLHKCYVFEHAKNGTACFLVTAITLSAAQVFGSMALRRVRYQHRSFARIKHVVRIPRGVSN